MSSKMLLSYFAKDGCCCCVVCTIWSWVSAKHEHYSESFTASTEYSFYALKGITKHV